MALEIFTTGAEDYGTYMKVLIVGDAGAGKTLISSTFPNPFYASAEGGLMSVASRRVRGTEIRSSDNLREVRRILDQPADVRAQILGGPVETVVIDTIDEIQKIFIRERMDAKRRENFEQQDWGWLGDQMRLVLRSFRNLDMNVVFTCHIKESTDQSTGQVFFKPMLQGSVGDEVSQYMDLALLLKTELATRIGKDGTTTERYQKRFLQTYKDGQHTWIKDRSGQLPSDFEVNFEDDYDRLHKAIFGYIGHDLQAAERSVTQGLQEIAAATAEPEPEPTGVDNRDMVNTDTQAAAEAVAEAISKAPAAEEKVEEPLKEEAPAADTTPPPGVDAETGEVTSDTGVYTCADCGSSFDSIDQKELGEIMLRRIVCSPCYREATKKK